MPSSRPRVKICCISSIEEAKLAIRAEADALGLVSAMPSGPGVIAEDQIAEIAAQVPPPVATFLLTSQHDAEVIIEQVRRCRTNTLQLVDRVAPSTYVQLRRALPGGRLVQVVHVRDEAALEEALEAAAHVDAVLLDSGNPGLDVKELGGTGRIHDWDVSRRIREQLAVPVFLAGGLKPTNVGAALRRVVPFGVDVCSGVRTAGRLDAAKLQHFMQQVRQPTQAAASQE